MTDDDRERRIRVRNARHATPDCLCDWCFILGRLDAERKRAGQAEATNAQPRIRVREMTAAEAERAGGNGTIVEEACETCGAFNWDERDPGCEECVERECEKEHPAWDDDGTDQ